MHVKDRGASSSDSIKDLKYFIKKKEGGRMNNTTGQVLRQVPKPVEILR